MWKYYNANPNGARVGDCAVRALCKATGREWLDVYCSLCVEGILRADMPSANAVWGNYLACNGFRKKLPRQLQTLEELAAETKGVCIAVLSGHVVTIVDGDYYDTWDSGNETVLYYWIKED